MHTMAVTPRAHREDAARHLCSPATAASQRARRSPIARRDAAVCVTALGSAHELRNPRNSYRLPVMDGADLDVELFIEEVKKYPEMWDVSCKEYHDKIVKRVAWYLDFTTIYG